MRKQKSLNNKGFSLVELIIVIAIMAILVGVLAPQLLKYVERSRQSKDITSVDTVHTAIVTARLDPAIADAPGSKDYTSLSELYGDTTSGTGHPSFVSLVKEIVGEADAASIENTGFSSNAYKDASNPIKITITASKVTCEVDAKDKSTGATDIKIE